LKTLDKGSFVLSLDTELAWGAVHHGSYAGRESDFAATRFVIDEILRLCEKYEIKATWAVVGHLFLSSCQPENGVKHPEIKRPQYPGFQGDWFHRDPCSDVHTEPWWYGPDIVRKLLACPVPQEVGSHNFSHVIIGASGCDGEVFSSELMAAKRAAGPWGIELKSFVYPRNAVGFTEVLRDHGFTSYRGASPDWTYRLPGPMRRGARFLDAFRPGTAPVVHPKYEDGIWNIPASYNYLHRSGWGRLVPVGVRVRKSVNALRKAARSGGVFHMWTHPFNIASDSRGLLAGLESIFQEVRSLRESGLISSVTMSELTQALEAERRESGISAREMELAQ
jgi:peptidoglycan/xylan/chitin deacetylase (PgdA/CDA1 family)